MDIEREPSVEVPSHVLIHGYISYETYIKLGALVSRREVVQLYSCSDHFDVDDIDLSDMEVCGRRVARACSSLACNAL